MTIRNGGSDAGGVTPWSRAERPPGSVAFREVNERIAELTRSAAVEGAKLVVCECSRPACAEALEVTVEEYEAVRQSGARFLVVPDHHDQKRERMVEENGRFAVVELLGQPALVAIDRDPRA